MFPAAVYSSPRASLLLGPAPCQCAVRGSQASRGCLGSPFLTEEFLAAPHLIRQPFFHIDEQCLRDFSKLAGFREGELLKVSND